MKLANFLNFWWKCPFPQLTNRWSHQWLFISLRDWRSTVENHKDFNFVNYSSYFCPKQFWGHFDKYIFENEHLWTLNICESWAFLSFSSVHWATIISAIEVWRYELYSMKMSKRHIYVWWTISIYKYIYIWWTICVAKLLSPWRRRRSSGCSSSLLSGCQLGGGCGPLWQPLQLGFAFLV